MPWAGARRAGSPISCRAIGRSPTPPRAPWSSGTGACRRGGSRPRPAAPRWRSSRGSRAGEVRAVWILCTNPAASMPDLDLVEKALRQAELVIVQDAYHPTETTRFADVLLPAAQWPEKDGVMTNSERCLTYLPKLVEPPGEALPDAVIVARLAERAGLEGGVRACRAPPRSSTSSRRSPRARPATIRASRMRASAPRGRCSGHVRPPTIPGTARLYTDGRFPPPTGAPAWCRWSRSRRRSRATRASPSP